MKSFETLKNISKAAKKRPFHETQFKNFYQTSFGLNE